MSEKAMTAHTIVDRIFEKYGVGRAPKTAMIHPDEKAALAREMAETIASDDGDLLRQIHRTASRNSKKCVHCQSIANLIDELIGKKG